MVSSSKTLIDNQLIYQSLGQAQLWKNVCLGTVDSGGDHPNKFVTLIVLSDFKYPSKGACTQADNPRG